MSSSTCFTSMLPCLKAPTDSHRCPRISDGCNCNPKCVRCERHRAISLLQPRSVPPCGSRPKARFFRRSRSLFGGDFVYLLRKHGRRKLHHLSPARKFTNQIISKSMSGSNHPTSRSPSSRLRSSSTVNAEDARRATAAPRGRERLAINFLAGGGEQPYPHLAGLQGHTRQRTNSAHYPSQSHRSFVPTPSQFNPGQSRVATGTGSYDPRGRTYHLEVVQHPERSAEFGSNALSRLPLAPPLIVQLMVRDQAGVSIRADDEIHFLVAHLSLYSGDGTPLDVEGNQGPSSHQGSGRLLYGTLVSSPQNYRNLQGRMGHYFIFPDVSIRRRGQYQLRISLMRLSRIDAPGLVGVGEQGSGALATAWTRPFDVVSQTNYAAPQHTQLTQYFVQQGARMYAFASSIHSHQSPH